VSHFRKGLSGNPKGRRPKLGHSFTDALRAQGTPDELAQLAWTATRQSAPWAIQMIFNRLESRSAESPIQQKSIHDNRTDCSRLTVDEIHQLEKPACPSSHATSVQTHPTNRHLQNIANRPTRGHKNLF
jgi:hypothetical protein